MSLAGTEQVVTQVIELTPELPNGQPSELLSNCRRSIKSWI
jgi:hypothetical protein